MNLTLEEQERYAYIDGDAYRAIALAGQIDAEAQESSLINRIERLEGLLISARKLIAGLEVEHEFGAIHGREALELVREIAYELGES